MGVDDEVYELRILTGSPASTNGYVLKNVNKAPATLLRIVVEVKLRRPFTFVLA
jgi:hypothetical protein